MLVLGKCKYYSLSHLLVQTGLTAIKSLKKNRWQRYNNKVQSTYKQQIKQFEISLRQTLRSLPKTCFAWYIQYIQPNQIIFSSDLPFL